MTANLQNMRVFWHLNKPENRVIELSDDGLEIQFELGNDAHVHTDFWGEKFIVDPEESATFNAKYDLNFKGLPFAQSGEFWNTFIYNQQNLADFNRELAHSCFPLDNYRLGSVFKGWCTLYEPILTPEGVITCIPVNLPLNIEGKVAYDPKTKELRWFDLYSVEREIFDKLPLPERYAKLKQISKEYGLKTLPRGKKGKSRTVYFYDKPYLRRTRNIDFFVEWDVKDYQPFEIMLPLDTFGLIASKPIQEKNRTDCEVFTRLRVQKEGDRLRIVKILEHSDVGDYVYICKGEPRMFLPKLFKHKKKRLKEGEIGGGGYYHEERNNCSEYVIRFLQQLQANIRRELRSRKSPERIRLNEDDIKRHKKLRRFRTSRKSYRVLCPKSPAIVCND